jgi:hypothetical protein
MIRPKEHHREAQYRPQAGKTLRQALIRFITREFPRLGGPWVIRLFVDKLLELADTYRMARDRLTPGQTLWPAVALDERPGYRKSMAYTRQVPVILTIANQDDVEELRNRTARTQIFKQALVRAAHDAYAQGGVLTTTDLAVLFHRSHSRVADMIRQYEAETGKVVPRRGNVHDIGRTVTHKHIICRLAYLEGKTTHVIAKETCHSPEAVDHYILNFARVYFATVQRGMTPEQTAFAIQLPLCFVQEYVKLIEEFGLDEQPVYNRAGVDLAVSDDKIEPTLGREMDENERREQDPIAG